MSRNAGKVKSKTEKVPKKVVKKQKSVKNKFRKKINKRSNNQKKFNQYQEAEDEMVNWEYNNDEFQEKKAKKKQYKKEKKKFKMDEKRLKNSHKSLLNDYNNFFTFFNIIKNKKDEVSGYENLKYFLEKDHIKVIFQSNEEKIKVASRQIEWKEKGDIELLANLVCFRETHKHVNKHGNLIEVLFKQFSNLNVNDFFKTNESYFLDYIRVFSSLSINDIYRKELLELNVYKYFAKFLYDNYKQLKSKYIILIEFAKMFNNFVLEENFTHRIKEKDITLFLNLSRKKNEMIINFMTMFWATISTNDPKFLSFKIKDQKDREMVLLMVSKVCEVIEKYNDSYFSIQVNDVPHSFQFVPSKININTIEFTYKLKYSGRTRLYCGKCH